LLELLQDVKKLKDLEKVLQDPENDESEDLDPQLVQPILQVIEETHQIGKEMSDLKNQEDSDKGDKSKEKELANGDSFKEKELANKAKRYRGRVWWIRED
jgi:hypothetical protein